MIKDEVLKQLELKRGQYLSGEELASSLHVTRNAVWKSIQTLKQQGYKIESVTNKGYSLSIENDIVSEKGISKYLNNAFYSIEVRKEVDSTNSICKELASNGTSEGTCVVACSQTKGRGRLGRTFFSPDDSGVYLSIVLRPKKNFELISFITSLTAVAASRAIDKVSKKESHIKWVNDIYIDRKKCSGILCEAVSDLECGGIEYIVVGIGFNVYEPFEGFNEEIKDIACAITSRDNLDAKNKIVGYFLNEFYELYHHFDIEMISKEYKEKSFIIGEEVTVVKNDTERKAKVLDIDKNCHLVVEFLNGERESLYSGEVRIRI